MNRRARQKAMLTSAVFFVAGLTFAQTPSISESVSGGPVPTCSCSATTPIAQKWESDSTKLDEAKRLFRAGNELFRSGDFAQALLYFDQSRSLVPSIPNTINSAICLDQLGRHDDALERYEEVITRFGEQLAEEKRQEIAPAMLSLRRKLGSLDVSANVDGLLVIDGRMRGKLPLMGPLRVLPGEHLVRVVKDGFGTFEKSVVIEVSATVQLDARLTQLASAGKLRVDEQALTGGTLFVDGAYVGTVPWEGTLAPGEHVLFAQRGDVGCGPIVAKVLVGQTVRPTIEARALGAPIQVVSTLSSAAIWIDGAPVARGIFRGRLTVGDHDFVAKEDGYLESARRVNVQAGAPIEVALAVVIDKEHPRWGIAAKGLFSLDLFGSLALGSGFGSSTEKSCESSTCDLHSSPFGWFTGLRAGYELPSRVVFSLGTGYMRVQSKQSRAVDDSFVAKTNPDTTVVSRYDYDETLRIKGPVVFAGLGYRVDLGPSFDLLAHLEAGVLSASTRDTIVATAAAGGITREAAVEGSGKDVKAIALMAMPSVEFRAKFGSLHVGMGLMTSIFLTEGPTLPLGDAWVASSGCSTATASTIDCAPGESHRKGEKAFGRPVLYQPQVSVGYTF